MTTSSDRRARESRRWLVTVKPHPVGVAPLTGAVLLMVLACTVIRAPVMSIPLVATWPMVWDSMVESVQGWQVIWLWWVSWVVLLPAVVPSLRRAPTAARDGEAGREGGCWPAEAEVDICPGGSPMAECRQLRLASSEELCCYRSDYRCRM